MAGTLVALSPAATAGVDAQLEAAVHLKILSFDRALAKRSSGRLLIGVVYRAGASSSESNAREIASGFNFLGRNKKVTVHGRSVRAMALPFSKDFDRVVRERGVSAIYVATGVGAALASIAGTARGRSLPTLCGRRDFVRQALAVAVVEKSGRPHIVIHIGHAKAVGMAIDPKLLRLAEIMR